MEDECLRYSGIFLIRSQKPFSWLTNPCNSAMGPYSSRINFTKYHCNSQTDGKMLRIAHSMVSNRPHLN